MRRRTLLAVSTAALASLAGCAGDSGGANESPTAVPPTGKSSDQSPQQCPTSTPRSKTISKRAGGGTDEPSTTAVSRRESGTACRGVSKISFYALGEIADGIWRQDTVWVDFSREASTRVRLVVLENDTVLGTTRVGQPPSTGTASAGVPITLRTELSGEHTIRVVAYPDTGEDGEFTPAGVTPCQHEGEIVRTESTTIDFSRFAEITSSTPRGT